MPPKTANIIFKGEGRPPSIAVKIWDEKKGLNISFPLDWVQNDDGDYIAHGVPLSAAQQIVANAKKVAKELPGPDPDFLLHTKEEYAEMGASRQMYDFYAVKLAPKAGVGKK